MNPAQGQTVQPATFVLVHGAWHGGWCWAPVVERLRAQGHECLAPTLRGLSHRQAALVPDLGADDHVDDVADLVEALDLSNVVLALHSYAGLLGPALLARLRGRVRHIAWLEAVVPVPGQRMLDLIAPAAAARYADLVEAQGEGWRMPAPDTAQFHLADAGLAARVARRLTPHPWRSFTEPLRAAQDDAWAFPGSYLIASDRDPQPYAGFATRALAAGWPVQRSPGGHLLMLTQPDTVAGFLLSCLRQPEEST